MSRPTRTILGTPLAIARRELVSLFRVPVGWIIIALFLLLTGVVFVSQTIVPGTPATMARFFSAAAWLFIPLAPAISMRLFSEELRTGTLEMLRTAPVTEPAAVIGKYLASIAFLLCLLIPSLVYPVLLSLIATEPGLDWGAVASGYLGLILVASFYLAVGTFASSCTSSQSLAFLGTLVTLVLMMLLSDPVAAKAPQRVAQVLVQLSVPVRMADFAKGLVTLANVVFFLSASVWVLTLASASLFARKWR